jgi:hypothetical protein
MADEAATAPIAPPPTFEKPTDDGPQDFASLINSVELAPSPEPSRQESRLPGQETQAETKENVEKAVTEQPAEAKTEAATPAEKKASERVKEFQRLTNREKKALEDRKSQAELGRMKAELESYREKERILRENPIEGIQKFGLEKNKLTDAYVKDLEKNPGTDKTAMLEAELGRIKAQLTQRDEEAQYEKARTALSKFDTETRDFVSKENLLHLKAEGDDGVDLVREIVSQHHAATGEIMDRLTACKLAEEHFQEKEKKRRSVLSGVEPAKAAPKPAQADKPKPVTLSSEMTRSAQQVPSSKKSELDEMLAWAKAQGA